MRFKRRIILFIAKCIGVKRGEKFPGWLYFTFYPMLWFYQRQSQIRYDIESHCYWIRGIRINGNDIDKAVEAVRINGGKA